MTIVEMTALSGAGLSEQDADQARRGFARAHDEAGQAGRVARDRLSGATETLRALTRLAGAPPPRPPFSFSVNPCGLFPQEAANAFWAAGLVPLNSVCLTWSETIVEVDGIPVTTLEPVPLTIDNERGRGKGGPKPSGRQDGPLLTPEEKLKIRAGIDRALAKGDKGAQLEAGVAQNLRARGIQVTGFQVKIVSRLGQTVGEIDIETPNAIVEVTSQGEGKLGQAQRLAGSRSLNPEGKKVIVYSTTYGKNAQASLAQADIQVARNIYQLVSLLKGLGS